MAGPNIAEWLPMLLLAVAASIYVVKATLELMGKAPGAALLRVENADLIRRNQELEATIGRHAIEITDLKLKIRDLEMTNQAAVLAALKAHEVGAMKRHETHIDLLTRVVEALETPPD